MASGPRYKVPFRRKREGRTNYHIRKKILRSGETRAVVRRSQKNVTVQFVDFTMEGDVILASASSTELRGMGWDHSCSSVPAAYLTGFLAAKKAAKLGVEYAVLDIGMQTPMKGGVLFAALNGMVDAGLEVPHAEEVLPQEDRILGKHIDESVEASVNGLKQKMEAE